MLGGGDLLNPALNPQELGSESKKTCPLGSSSGVSRPYWNPTPKPASRPCKPECESQRDSSKALADATKPDRLFMAPLARRGRGAGGVGS